MLTDEDFQKFSKNTHIGDQRDDANDKDAEGEKVNVLTEKFVGEQVLLHVLADDRCPCGAGYPVGLINGCRDDYGEATIRRRLLAVKDACQENEEKEEEKKSRKKLASGVEEGQAEEAE